MLATLSAMSLITGLQEPLVLESYATAKMGEVKSISRY